MKLAVIGTFYERHQNTLPLLRRVMLESTRPPDEFWIMCENRSDREVVWQAFHELGLIRLTDQIRIVWLPTKKEENGSYSVIPYSNKINAALDRTEADVICYLDNGSMPHEEKYEHMFNVLEWHPEMGAVFCGQKRTGHIEQVVDPCGVIEDAYCVLNYTQVMHRKTEDRWTLDMQYANPDIADALFWRALHKTLGPFYSTYWGVLDEHHIESASFQA